MIFISTYVSKAVVRLREIQSRVDIMFCIIHNWVAKCPEKINHQKQNNLFICFDAKMTRQYGKV